MSFSSGLKAQINMACLILLTSYCTLGLSLVKATLVVQYFLG